MFESMIFRMWYWIWFGFSQTSSLLGLYSVCRMFACRQVVIEFIRFLQYFTIYALNWSQEESYDSPTLHTPLCIGEVSHDSTTLHTPLCIGEESHDSPALHTPMCISEGSHNSSTSSSYIPVHCWREPW